MTEAQTNTTRQSAQAFADADTELQAVLKGFPEIVLALVFGSVAAGKTTFASDLDIAVSARQALTTEQKMAIVGAFAAQTGRPIDLIDLATVGQPLLGQIVRHGRRLRGRDADYGRLISRHLLEQADFLPLRNRILKERRDVWIGK